MLAALVLAASAAGATGQGALIAKRLKPQIVKTWKAHGSTNVFGKVTCVLPATATVGQCKAYFTNAAARQMGWIVIAAKVNRTSGALQWQAIKAMCLDPQTHAAAPCP